MWQRDLDSDQVKICANMAFLMGMPKQPCYLSSSEWQDRIHAEDLPAVEHAVAQACNSGQPFRFEFRVRREDGNLMWVQARGHVSLDANSRPIRISGVSLDITDKKNAEAELRESEARFRQLADASPDAIFVHADERHVYANRAAATMLGVESPTDLAKYTLTDFVDRPLLASIRESVATQLASGGTTRPFTVPFRRVDGSNIVAEVTYGKVIWKGKSALQILCRDVTQQKANEEKLRIANERLKLAIEGSGEAIWDLNLTTGTYVLSGGLSEVLGYPEDDVPRSRDEWRKIIHPEDLTRVSVAFQACLAGRAPNFRCEYRIRTKDGSWKWIFSRGVIVSRADDGKPTAMTGTITDVTARKESEEMAWRHANLDPLTGLPNRRHFLIELGTELRKATRSSKKTALLFIDLDGFKQVNDLFGHDAGDFLLMEVADRIRKAIRETDGLARLGGDEFTVLLTDLHAPDHVEFVCQDMLARLSQPFGIGNEFAYVSASIGVAISPVDAASADELLRKADTAMYAAKTAGKNQFSYFTQSMDDNAHRRLRMSTDLRQAIAANQLRLHFQPVIDLRNGQVVKAEALLRWQHPTLGRIEPAAFIPIAEEAGLMGSIGNWVFREAAVRTKQWSERAGKQVKVALNKASVQFSRRYMESDWLAFLMQIGVPPSSIVIEITEGVLLNASPYVYDKLIEYRDAGIQVAIDDFGIGYSSLAYLQKFDIDYLKIDQSFIHDIPANPANCTMAETFIVMAHKLGPKVVAKGIETREQAEFLMQAGCDYGQGFYFEPPVPEYEVEKLLSRCYL